MYMQLGVHHIFKTTHCIANFQMMTQNPHANTDCMRVYGELTISAETTSTVRQGCPILPFLFNFAMDEEIRDVLGFQDAEVDLGNEKKL